LPTVFGRLSAASGINDAGQIVGWFSNAAGTHGFLLSGSKFTTVDVPGAALGTQALGISATGQIVGVFTDAESISHGFLLSGGTFATVDVPVAMRRNTAAHGVNVTGQIVGTFVDVNQTRARLSSIAVRYRRLCRSAIQSSTLAPYRRPRTVPFP